MRQSPADPNRVLALVAQQSTGFNLPNGSGSGQPEDLSIDDLFSLRKPKHVMSGASSGLQSLAKGVRAPLWAWCISFHPLN